jgi:hypothetical protein
MPFILLYQSTFFTFQLIHLHPRFPDRPPVRNICLDDRAELLGCRPDPINADLREATARIRQGEDLERIGVKPNHEGASKPLSPTSGMVGRSRMIAGRRAEVVASHLSRRPAVSVALFGTV